MQSSALGDGPTTKALLAHGAHINARGMSLYAAARGNGDFRRSTALIEACLRDDGDIVRLLVTHGASINVHDNAGTTPLSAALWKSDGHLANFLVRRGARATNTERKRLQDLLNRE